MEEPEKMLASPKFALYTLFLVSFSSCPISWTPSDDKPP